MGVVYEAYDPDLARRVALKLVNVAAWDHEAALDEAKALAKLSHPNVVPIYDVGLDRDHVYLVMELVRGKTLRQWPGDHTLCELLVVYQQAGVALAAAHDACLVHRDFKPDNAIVGTDGRVRVVDFGLACEADEPACAAGERRRVAGTPHFMAPEIKARGAITPAADQYSFCVALADALALVKEPRRAGSPLRSSGAGRPILGSDSRRWATCCASSLGIRRRRSAQIAGFAVRLLVASMLDAGPRLGRPSDGGEQQGLNPAGAGSPCCLFDR